MKFRKTLFRYAKLMEFLIFPAFPGRFFPDIDRNEGLCQFCLVSLTEPFDVDDSSISWFIVIRNMSLIPVTIVFIKFSCRKVFFKC